MGVIAIGGGGLDIACVLAGYPFQMVTPKIVKVELHGELNPWVFSKDIILTGIEF